MKKSFLLVVIVPAIIFIGLGYTLVPFFSSQHIQGVYDTFISTEYATSINAAVAELMHNNISTHAIINQLQQQFPFLKKITVAYQPLAVRVMMSTHKPLCLINNSWVLTTQTEIFPKNIFSDKTVTMIPHITVIDEKMKNMSSMVTQLLQRLSDDIHGGYNVEFLNEHCVYLIDKKQPNFTIISSLVPQKLSPLLTHCNAVKHTLSERGEFNKDSKWIADTRFVHYIVAYRA